MTDTIKIYMNPKMDIEVLPDTLQGDMSVFEGYRNEVQWLFYLMLKSQGTDVEICRDFPEEGILVIHKGNVQKFAWNPNLYVVSGQWDYPRDDRAQIHLVSNKHKTTSASLGVLDRLAIPGRQCYLPPVTHPVIIPRNPERGDRFEHIAFIGDPKNLDPAFRTDAFKDQVAALGMKFIINSDPNTMADFSEVDALLAVRQLGRVISNKPSTKLINGWRGGVPSILGCEIGFREARENELDYIEVDSVEDVISALTRLRDDLSYRKQVIENGDRRAAAFTSEVQSRLWAAFFKETVIPEYHEWLNRPAIMKWLFLTVRWLRYSVREAMSYIWHRILKRSSRDYSVR